MEIDLADVGSDLDGVAERLRSQVCIVGGGVAGLLLAHRLLQAGVSVTLLEAGGRARAEPDGVDPFQAELQGHPHPGTREGRVRALGGCSITWGGQLLPLPDDAGWPVSRAELLPYEAEADRLFGVDGLPYDAAELFRARGAGVPSIGSGADGVTVVASKFIPFGRRNLGSTLGAEVAGHGAAKMGLHAPVFELVGAAGRVEAAMVRSPRGRTMRVEAGQFVVAAGTVETCRLLLASRSGAAEGIGNAYGRVGARFQDHLTLRAAVFAGPARDTVLRELGPRVFVSSASATVHSLKLGVGAAAGAEFGGQPGMAHITVEEPEDSGAGLIRELLRARQQGRLAGQLRADAGRIPAALMDGLRLAWAARVRRRRYVSPRAEVRLQLNLAQGRETRSRVSLSEECDGLGMPKAKVFWEISGAELAGVRRFALRMRELLRAAGVDEGTTWEPALFESGAESEARLLGLIEDARHAMGGACMGVDPRGSVVDPELRVHGVENLSVASAAVFPDGSAQLPTLTLAALALRLADRLARQLG